MSALLILALLFSVGALVAYDGLTREPPELRERRTGLVASCRGKQPIERFGAAALANYLDIRSEPQGGAHQLPIRACASAFDVRAMGIQWDRRGVILVQR